MSDSIVERVARLLCQYQNMCPGHPSACMGCKTLARTVIAAMREPTSLMLQDGYEVLGGLDWLDDQQLSNGWQAMIDAALDDTPKSNPCDT